MQDLSTIDFWLRDAHKYGNSTFPADDVGFAWLGNTVQFLRVSIEEPLLIRMKI